MIATNTRGDFIRVSSAGVTAASGASYLMGSARASETDEKTPLTLCSAQLAKIGRP